MRRAALLWLAPPALVCAGPLPARAAVYLTAEEAQRAIFPGVLFTPRPLVLDEARARAVEERSGMRVRERNLRRWRGGGGEWLYVDAVLGKHEDIVYALGLRADGSIAGLEILEYRETYGGEIREAEWRRQFEGKRAGDALRLGEGIANVSGATLSCRHVTDGVRRLLATHEVAGD